MGISFSSPDSEPSAQSDSDDSMGSSGRSSPDRDEEAVVSGADDSRRSDTLPEDLLFDLLAASRRRAVLRHLDRNGGDCEFGALTEAVALTEGFEEDANRSEYKHVYVSLYQSHVPKLEAAGVIVHDRDSQTVELTPAADPLIEYLEFSPRSRQSRFLSRLTERLP